MEGEMKMSCPQIMLARQSNYFIVFTYFNDIQEPESTRELSSGSSIVSCAI